MSLEFFFLQLYKGLYFFFLLIQNVKVVFWNLKINFTIRDIFFNMKFGLYIVQQANDDRETIERSSSTPGKQVDRRIDIQPAEDEDGIIYLRLMNSSNIQLYII